MSSWLSLQLLDLLIGIEGSFLSAKRINLVNKMVTPLGSLWPFPSLPSSCLLTGLINHCFWTSLLVCSQCPSLVDVWRLLTWAVFKKIGLFFVFLNHRRFDPDSRNDIMGFVVTVVMIATLLLTGAMIVEN